MVYFMYRFALARVVLNQYFLKENLQILRNTFRENSFVSDLILRKGGTETFLIFYFRKFIYKTFVLVIYENDSVRFP